MDELDQKETFILSLMKGFSARIVSTYTILLFLLFHNIFQYLIKQKKYTQIHLSLFYGIATTSTIYKIIINLCLYNGNEIIGRV